MTVDTAPNLPKIESYYNFQTLKKDLTGFAKVGYDEFLSDTRLPQGFAVDSPFGVITDDVLASLDARTEALLKGNDLFESIDSKTSAQLLTIIQDNLSGGVAAMISEITRILPEMTKNRAGLIAETEAANALEGTRHAGYVNEFAGGTKEWVSVHDDRVRPSHQANDRQGKIPMANSFSSGEDRAGESPRCRCTVLYYPPSDYLN